MREEALKMFEQLSEEDKERSSLLHLLFYKIRQSFIKTRLPIGREHIIHLHENLGSLAGSRGFFCFRGFFGEVFHRNVKILSNA